MRHTTMAELDLAKPTVRIWDRDHNLLHDLTNAAAVTAATPTRYEVALDPDSPAAKSLKDLTASNPRLAYLTVDVAGERWLGRLQQYTIDRVGPCEQCEHCMRKWMNTTWIAGV